MDEPGVRESWEVQCTGENQFFSVKAEKFGVKHINNTKHTKNGLINHRKSLSRDGHRQNFHKSHVFLRLALWTEACKCVGRTEKAKCN